MDPFRIITGLPDPEKNRFAAAADFFFGKQETREQGKETTGKVIFLLYKTTEKFF